MRTAAYALMRDWEATGSPGTRSPDRIRMSRTWPVAAVQAVQAVGQYVGLHMAVHGVHDGSTSSTLNGAVRGGRGEWRVERTIRGAISESLTWHTAILCVI